jgi:short-subunit dehydrogenase
MFVYKGKTALVTGASSGIGETFAHVLAARGMNLLLVARSIDKLQALASELSKRHGVQVHAVPVDLSQPAAAATLRATTDRVGLDIDLLVNNAGFGTYGAFETQSATREREEIDLNCGALVDLTHAYVPDMLRRGAGGVINVSSTAGFQPVPFMAVYGATKAFVLSFSEALAEEVRTRGVHVVALCPGPTETAFFHVAGNGARLPSRRTSEQVVATGLAALEAGRCVAIDGFGNALMAFSTRLVPRALVARVAAGKMGPRAGDAAKANQ